ncbi:hypothetical protein N9W62_09115 [Akkermansiaceae bacterium]|nr:hypothetical protein [Akkermansiaceae bacterium]
MRYLTVVMISTLVGFFFSTQLVTNWNPEFKFWRNCVERKRSKHERVVIFAGGSSCAFSITPDVLKEEVSIPSYNMGGAIPMGADYLLSMSMGAARPGDTVVLAIGTSFLTTDEAARSKALGVALAAHDFENGTLDVGVNWADLLLKRRPGARFVTTFFGKKVMGIAGYRYSMEDFRRGGLLTTSYRDGSKSPNGALASLKLSVEGVAFLKAFIEHAKKKNVRLLYSMPWTFTEPKVAQNNRNINREFLREIEKFLPVIEDSFYGVHTDPAYFGDTLVHLTKEGAAARTRAIATSLEELAFQPQPIFPDKQ